MDKTTIIRGQEGPLFRGGIKRNIDLERAQSGVSRPEADSSIYWDPSEKIPSDEAPTSLHGNSERRPEKTRSPKSDRSKHFNFSVHYASHRNQADAEAEVARLSKKGLHAWWGKKDLAGKGEWFRVYIGKEKTYQDAMNLALKLKDDGVIREIRVYKVITD